MSRPKFFRDPVHVQLRFESVDISAAPPRTSGESQRSWLLRKIIDCPEFQRLRFVRQNGLANFVFHGAEHTRFTHSVGVAHLANEMYGRIVRNMGENPDDALRAEVSCAALLHDIGHGPFSHTMEEILASFNVNFDHERMTVRLISENDSSINSILKSVDSGLPNRIAAFIDKTLRPADHDHWTYRLVSSQLDADRLDYLLRDAMFAGLKGHGFDLARLLDLLYHHDGRKIAVERGAIEAVEAYLLALDQMYRAIYYHHAIRAANFVLTSAVRRAVSLHRNGDASIFPQTTPSRPHPMKLLVEHGDEIPLSDYLRLGEHQLWVLLDHWTASTDPVLKDLSGRVLNRQLFKSKAMPLHSAYSEQTALLTRAKQLAINAIEHVNDSTVDFYVGYDEPGRVSYKRYDWTSEGAEESIWMVGEGREPCPIEEEESSKIVSALKEIRYFPRLIVPHEIKASL